MRPPRMAALATAALALAIAAPCFSATSLELEIRFGPERFSLTTQGDLTEVHVTGAMQDLTAGRPALPWVSELIELPLGTRVAGVEVTGLETAPLAEGVRLPSTVVPKPGLGPIERSTPDPAYFERAGFQPETPVVLGTQGWQRGRGYASLRICPVRWDAKSGRLERVSRLTVRLTLAPATDSPVARYRIVPEWEELGGVGIERAAAPLSAAAGIAPLPNRGFAATQVPSLLGSPVAYVIITNDAMASEFQRLADWKTQSGVPAVVRTLSFIRQEYPRGADDAERIRDFIKDAYSRWGTEWVLLGGDTDVIPTRLVHSNYYGGEDIACDMYYSCLDGNWNADGDALYGEPGAGTVDDPGDSVDFYPDVYVGRAPTSTPADVHLFVDKTFQYTRTPDGTYENSMLMMAEVLFPENWQPGKTIVSDGASYAEELLPWLQLDPAMRNVRLYQNYTDTTWAPGALPETRQAALDSLNRGYGLTLHIGHGYRNVMSVGDGDLYNPDALGLTNGTHLTCVYATNCTSNAIDFPCIGEAFMKAPKGGAVVNVGSTRLDFPAASHNFQKEYFRLIFQDSVTAAGEVQARQKLPLISASDQDNTYRWMEFTLLMLGDPELHIWTGPPRTLAVTHGSTMTLGDSVFTVHVQVGATPLAGARVAAYKQGDEYRVGLTDGAGNVTLAFAPDSLGTFTVTVTGYDCRPYVGTVTMVSGGTPVLADLTPTVDDDSAGGTVGNANGLWDAGETIDLRVPLRNNGVTTATSVTGTLKTADPLVAITTPTVSYGTIVPTGSTTPSGAFRLNIPYTVPDQREIPFTLRLIDGVGHTSAESFQIVLRAPDLRHYAHAVSDAGGNSDGRPDPGEVVTYTPVLKNLGTGMARQVTAKLRSLDGLALVTDSTSSWGTISAGEEKSGDALVFVPAQTSARLALVVSDEYGVLFIQTLDLTYPAALPGISCTGQATSIQLVWSPSAEPDLLGYNVYRSSSSGGPFTRVNAVPTDRVSSYNDSPLAPLTRYYYEVTVVDSSGNESAPSPVAFASTNPPPHSGFPIPFGAETFAPVAVDHLYPGYPLDVAVGADVLYVWHSDGLAPLDADGSGSTSGDFTVLGDNYAGGASIADLDGDGAKEVIGVASDSMRVVVLDQLGHVKPGWPRAIYDGAWSSAAIGDIDNDGHKEIVFGGTTSHGSLGNRLYAFHYDGTEVRDGDSNPTTIGVFKMLGTGSNFGTPVIADLDGNGVNDIIYGSFDGKLNAWRADGSSLPGFPVQLPGPISSSVAAGYLDGPGDTQLDLAVVTGSFGDNPDSLYVYTATGVRRAGFPISLGRGNNLMAPSPALADMNNDGFVDIVVANTNGKIYVYDRNGSIVPPWNGVAYSTLTSYATQASPVVADIDGDGLNDIVIGDETGMLTALGGAGTVLPGFPIKLGAEVKGAAALCDCDGDGQTEIVVAGWDKNVYIWDYPFPFSPHGAPPWPQFHHDALRTGLMTNPAFVEVGPPAPAGTSTAIEFAAPMPNPARGGARTWYAVPSDRAGSRLELAIYDLAGRKVRVLAQGTARAGRSSAAWDLRDASGLRVGPGVYFIRLALDGESFTHKFVVVD